MVIKLVHIIIIQDQRVLLQKRQNTGAFDNYYSLPGGKIEENETAEVAGIREAKEELDIDVVELSAIWRSEIAMDGNRVYDNNFVYIHRYKGAINNNEPHKCSELAYYPISSLPTPIIPGVTEGLNLVVSKTIGI